MAVQISRKTRTAQLSNLTHRYLAYFGRYEIDAERRVVRHVVEGELFPGAHSETLEHRCSGLQIPVYRFNASFLPQRFYRIQTRRPACRRV